MDWTNPYATGVRLFICIILCFTFIGCGSANWPVPSVPTGWLYRQQITISSSMAPSNQTDFPVLIKITDQGNPIFGRALSTGNDILFTSSDGQTKLDHEIEYYKNTTTKELDAWVRMPTLSSSDNTIIYMYYGNSSASNQENVTGVWDSNYAMVQHLQEAPANGVAGHIDSTSNPNDGTPYNFDGIATSTTDGTGQINGADIFDGSNDYVTVVHDPTLNLGTGDFTIIAWVKPKPNAGSTIPTIVGKHDVPWNFYWYLGLGSNNKGEFSHNGFSGTIQTTNTIDDDQWHFLTVVREGSTLSLYHQGLKEAETTTAASADNNEVLHIGGDPIDADYWFDGTIDEVRISSTARSADWVKASYNNQNSPGTYLTFGAQESF